jgi:nitrogen regulatory protein P-II 1
VKRIEAYVRVNRLEAVKQSLEEAGITGLSVEQVRGFGRQQGQHDQFRGSTYALNLVPKTKIETVVADDQVEDAIKAIVDAAHSGEPGDGKIFVSEVLEAVRIRTGERGQAALE